MSPTSPSGGARPIVSARGTPSLGPTAVVQRMHSSSGPTYSPAPGVRSIVPSPLRSRDVSITPLPLRSTQSSSRFAYLVIVPWLPNARFATYASKF
jgi:hypothetical protein